MTLRARARSSSQTYLGCFIPRLLVRAKKLTRLSLSLFLAQKNARRAFSRSDAEDKREKMMGVNDDVLDISLSGGPYRKEDFFFPSHLGFCFFKEFFSFFRAHSFFSNISFFLSFFHSFIPRVRARACALCVISLRLERRAEREGDFKGALFSRILCIRHREAAQKQARGELFSLLSIGKRFNRDELLTRGRRWTTCTR